MICCRRDLGDLSDLIFNGRAHTMLGHGTAQVPFERLSLAKVQSVLARAHRDLLRCANPFLPLLWVVIPRQLRYWSDSNRRMPIFLSESSTCTLPIGNFQVAGSDRKLSNRKFQMHSSNGEVPIGTIQMDKCHAWTWNHTGPVSAVGHRKRSASACIRAQGLSTRCSPVFFPWSVEASWIFSANRPEIVRESSLSGKSGS